MRVFGVQGTCSAGGCAWARFSTCSIVWRFDRYERVISVRKGPSVTVTSSYIPLHIYILLLFWTPSHLSWTPEPQGKITPVYFFRILLNDSFSVHQAIAEPCPGKWRLFQTFIYLFIYSSLLTKNYLMDHREFCCSDAITLISSSFFFCIQYLFKIYFNW